MKRVLVIAAAAALLLSPFVASGQDRGGWPHGGGGAFQRFQMADRDRGDRGERHRDAGPGPGRGRGRDQGPYGDPGRGYPRDDGRGDPGYDPRAYDRRGPDPRGRPMPAPAPYAAPRASRANRSYRQGDYLPPMYRGSVVRDPGRYRLRAPPPGYDWVGVGPDIYLMQRNSGMVLDTIPGGY